MAKATGHGLAHRVRFTMASLASGLGRPASAGLGLGLGPAGTLSLGVPTKSTRTQSSATVALAHPASGTCPRSLLLPAGSSAGPLPLMHVPSVHDPGGCLPRRSSSDSVTQARVFTRVITPIRRWPIWPPRLYAGRPDRPWWLARRPPGLFNERLTSALPVVRSTSRLAHSTEWHPSRC